MVVRLVYFGSNANNGTNTRPFYLNANNSTSNTNANISAGLFKFKRTSLVTPELQNYTSLYIGSFNVEHVEVE